MRKHSLTSNLKEPPSAKRRKGGDGDREGAKGFPAGVTIEDVEGEDLEIKKIETSKDLIEQPRLAQDPRKIIPHRGASIVINGASGSGKSTLLANYIQGPQFFGKSKERPEGWFDKTFLFSPTADGDDVQKSLGIDPKHVYTDMEEAPELLKVILGSQKEKLSGGGKAHKVEQFCVIFDDVIGEKSFLNTKEFMQMFYMVRHRNCTTIICSQHYKRVPKVCRQQASFIHFFAGSAAEVDTIVEDFAPPMYTKNEFRDIVNSATCGDHAFLTVCMKVGWEYRFRRNLDKFIKLDRLTSGEEEMKGSDAQKKPETKKKDPKEKISEDTSKRDFHSNLKALVKYFKAKHEHHEQTRP